MILLIQSSFCQCIYLISMSHKYFLKIMCFKKYQMRHLCDIMSSSGTRHEQKAVGVVTAIHHLPTTITSIHFYKIQSSVRTGLYSRATPFMRRPWLPQKTYARENMRRLMWGGAAVPWGCGPRRRMFWFSMTQKLDECSLYVSFIEDNTNSIFY